ncbi:MAG TPA: hypothetical protein VLC46_25310 [Thermoanaerobaculia bacterium]|nr:hypothetical protein [Thermoanaerobaculia bacterium]
MDILDSNGVPRFSHILRGAMLRANVRALVAAEEEAGREEASARILLVPELFFAAVWLIQGRRNLFVAIERDMMSSSSELRRRLLPRFRRLRERSLRSENG